MGEEEIAEILVVGAGPVGMTAALMLAEQGLKATVIDAAAGTAAHSYACALHPHSLELLDRFGLLEEILQWGRPIHRMAFYEGDSRRAEVRFADLSGKTPFAVVLPQNALEWLLERTLNRRAGIQVRWRERLNDLSWNGEAVMATVEPVDPTTASTVARPSEPFVRRTKRINAAFMVGADGHGSLVRRSLALDFEPVGPRESHLIFEFETETEPEDEVRVVLDESTTSVLWPISSHRCRWSFQVAHQPSGESFPEKVREESPEAPPPHQGGAKQQLRQLLEERAPWFKAPVGRLNWLKQVLFERRLVRQFRVGRCCLIGDAAHQTGPVGVQSFNVGMREAHELVGALSDFCSNNPAIVTRQSWGERWHQEWRMLLGQKGAPRNTGHADDWVRHHADRMLSSLPASGNHLSQLLSQLGLSLP